MVEPRLPIVDVDEKLVGKTRTAVLALRHVVERSGGEVVLGRWRGYGCARYGRRSESLDCGMNTREWPEMLNVDGVCATSRNREKDCSRKTAWY